MLRTPYPEREPYPPVFLNGKPLRLCPEAYLGTPHPLPPLPAPSLTPHESLDLLLHLCGAPAYPACPITGRTFPRQAAERAGRGRVVTTFFPLPLHRRA